MIAPLADTVARARKSGLDLSLVPPPLLEQARRAFAERDAQGFVWSVGSQAELQLVLDNLFPLRAAGIYERALLEGAHRDASESRPLVDRGAALPAALRGSQPPP